MDLGPKIDHHSVPVRGRRLLSPSPFSGECPDAPTCLGTAAVRHGRRLGASRKPRPVSCPVEGGYPRQPSARLCCPPPRSWAAPNSLSGADDSEFVDRVAQDGSTARDCRSGHPNVTFEMTGEPTFRALRTCRSALRPGWQRPSLWRVVL
jgi:hypothetical protein